MTRKYFNANNLEELKVQYKKLAMQHHPDRGGNTATMQEINNQYDELFEQLKNIINNNEKNKHKVNETCEKYRDFIGRIIGLDGLTLEICGNWIWVSGETKKHKDWLKQVGCKWASKKKLWYWRAEEYKSYNRGKYSMDEIRNKYGSESIHSSARPQLV